MIDNEPCNYGSYVDGVAWDFFNEKTTHDLFCREINFVLKTAIADSKYGQDAVLSADKIAIGVSGGSDSLSLLFLMKNWADFYEKQLVCVTVDHNLRKESHEEAVFVAKVCQKIGVRHTILDWIREDNNQSLNHGKLENLARDARYRLISDFCEKESINFVAVGHTWNDQLETFEMRKNSKSGDYGLAGMSRVRSVSNSSKFVVKIIRPLMVFSRKHLRSFLENKKIAWKDDPMNDDIFFRRVFYRKNISKMNVEELQKKTVFIKSLGAKRCTIEKEAVIFLKQNIKEEEARFGYMTFDAKEFWKCSEEAQKEILKRAIWDVGGKKYAPKIDSVDSTLFPMTIGRCLVKVSSKRIMIFRENRNLDQKIFVEKPGVYVFDNRFRITVNNHSSFAKTVISACKNSDNNSGIPRAACCSLPCIYSNTNFLFAYGIENSIARNIDIEYMHKVNLFDIFL